MQPVFAQGGYAGHHASLFRLLRGCATRSPKGHWQMLRVDVGVALAAVFAQGGYAGHHALPFRLLRGCATRSPKDHWQMC